MSRILQPRTLSISSALRQKWAHIQARVGIPSWQQDGLPGDQTADSVLRVLHPVSEVTPSAADPSPEPPPPNAPLEDAGAGQFPEREILSPNFTRRPNDRLHLVLHHCGGWARTGDPNTGTLSWCLNPASGVSYHVLIAWDGTRTILVPEQYRAHQAGRSSWRGRPNCNEYTIGLAWGGDTVSGARRPDNSPLLTAPELQSGIEWIIPRMRHYGWTLDDIITHAQIAPGRRNDVSPQVHDQVRSEIARHL